jgi:hypothetical protein
MDLEATRRGFLGSALGTAALAALSGEAAAANARARRVIFLFQFGGPSQYELFDPKPALARLHGTELPASVREMGEISGLTREQKSLPLVGSFAPFSRCGESGLPLSDLIPHTRRLADRICLLKAVSTDAVAHDPALRFLQTGSILDQRPSTGAWVTYGIGSEAKDLPAYVVLISNGRGDRDTQPLGARLWGSGFLPSTHQGIQFRASGDPVLYLADPPGVDGPRRRAMLDAVEAMNGLTAARSGDPEVRTRISQYELAYRMQTSIPSLLDLSGEPEETFHLYGADARKPGTYAANCLLARRMAERGVRFIQLFHRGWDQHGNLPAQIRLQCEDTDQATAALLRDLERRGMLEDTLVVWGGEFGRTAYCQGKLEGGKYGRDHHGRAFSMWLAGGGVKGGMSHGETDELGTHAVSGKVEVRDLHATLLHCLGLRHDRLSFKYQGLDQRLTGVEPARVIREILG